MTVEDRLIALERENAESHRSLWQGLDALRQGQEKLVHGFEQMVDETRRNGEAQRRLVAIEETKQKGREEAAKEERAYLAAREKRHDQFRLKALVIGGSLAASMLYVAASLATGGRVSAPVVGEEVIAPPDVDLGE